MQIKKLNKFSTELVKSKPVAIRVEAYATYPSGRETFVCSNERTGSSITTNVIDWITNDSGDKIDTLLEYSLWDGRKFKEFIQDKIDSNYLIALKNEHGIVLSESIWTEKELSIENGNK